MTIEPFWGQVMRSHQLHLRTIMLAIGMIGLGLGLAVSHPGILCCMLVLAWMAGPASYLTRMMLAGMTTRGESVSMADRIGLFLALLLLTAPICGYLSLMIFGAIMVVLGHLNR
jgi:hypothetical protein